MQMEVGKGGKIVVLVSLLIGLSYKHIALPLCLNSQIGMTYLSSSHSIMEVVLSLCGWTEGHRNRNDTITTVAATSNNSMYTTERAKW